jgi:hypothetical protein
MPVMKKCLKCGNEYEDVCNQCLIEEYGTADLPRVREIENVKDTPIIPKPKPVAKHNGIIALTVFLFIVTFVSSSYDTSLGWAVGILSGITLMVIGKMNNLPVLYVVGILLILILAITLIVIMNNEHQEFMKRLDDSCTVSC